MRRQLSSHFCSGKVPPCTYCSLHVISFLPRHPAGIYPLECPFCRYIRVSGCVQDWEHMQCPGTCRAPMYLRGVTQGEWVPAECLSRSVIIMYKSKYVHGGLYLRRSEKKAAFSSYSSPDPYNIQVMQRKELNQQAVTHYL